MLSVDFFDVGILTLEEIFVRVDLLHWRRIFVGIVGIAESLWIRERRLLGNSEFPIPT
jgi:hypothetical protein